MKFIAFDKLSKTEILLYWAKFCSRKQGAITPFDKIKLVEYKVFKDKKAVSNALYQLHLCNYIVKHNEDWYITDFGEAYICLVLDNLAKETEPKAKGPKKNEWTDADFGITPEVREYIDSLEAENLELKKKLEASSKETIKLHDDLQRAINSNNYIRESNDALRAKIEKYESDMTRIWRDIMKTIQECHVC